MEIQKLNKTDKYVYDISLDGTVVNALGINILSNTDGFNFQMPKTFRYTDEHPYISDGGGRNSEKGKAYTKVEADVASKLTTAAANLPKITVMNGYKG